MLPTATNNAIGSEKFAVGPTAVVLTQPGHWTLGMLFNQYRSVSGASDREDVSQALFQPLLNYNFGKALALGVSRASASNGDVGAGGLPRGRRRGLR